MIGELALHTDDIPGRETGELAVDNGDDVIDRPDRRILLRV